MTRLENPGKRSTDSNEPRVLRTKKEPARFRPDKEFVCAAIPLGITVGYPKRVSGFHAQERERCKLGLGCMATLRSNPDFRNERHFPGCTVSMSMELSRNQSMVADKALNPIYVDPRSVEHPLIRGQYALD